jgi:hypothetical protein
MAGFLILAPILMMGLELVAVGGRVAAATADVQSAAHEAARQASLAQSQGSAATVIGPVALEALAGKGFQCQNPVVALGSATTFGPGGQVQVQVQCTVNLSDIDLLNLPGSITIGRAATEPIDRYRAVD